MSVTASNSIALGSTTNVSSAATMGTVGSSSSSLTTSASPTPGSVGLMTAPKTTSVPSSSSGMPLTGRLPTSESGQVLNKRRVHDLVREIDPNEQLDDDVEELLLQISDDFIETVVNNACLLAKHRGSNMLEVKDIQLVLERNHNMYIPGFGTDELRPYKKAAPTEAHKQRLALIKKALKKY